MGNLTTRPVGHTVLRSSDGNGVGGALMGADLAADTRRHLHRRQHHPWALRSWSGNGTVALIVGGALTHARWTGHIQTADRAEIHTNAAIDTGDGIDAKLVGHADLLTERSTWWWLRDLACARMSLNTRFVYSAKCERCCSHRDQYRTRRCHDRITGVLVIKREFPDKMYARALLPFATETSSARDFSSEH